MCLIWFELLRFVLTSTATTPSIDERYAAHHVLFVKDTAHYMLACSFSTMPRRSIHQRLAACGNRKASSLHLSRRIASYHRTCLQQTFSSTTTSTTPAPPDVPVYDQQYINGRWTPSDSLVLLTVTNSNNGEHYASVIAGTSQDTSQAIAAASAALPNWSQTLTLQDRKSYMSRFLEAFEKRSGEVTTALQHELGAPYKFARNVQTALLPLHVREYLKIVDEYSWETIEDTFLIVREPIGVVGAITPWNWPLNQIAVKLAPSLLAGCTVVLKPSEVTPINAYLIAQAIDEANFPPGVFNMVCGTGPDVGQVLATHPLIDMVSFTGSTAVGRHLHALGAQTIKRVRSELGGKSAAIVLEDATEEQIRMVAGDVLQNTGQSCNALSRLLVPTARYAEVCDMAKEIYESVRLVDARDETSGRDDIGPLVSQEQLEKVQRYINIGIEEDGATLLTGGSDAVDDGVDPRGFFVRPTAFADVSNSMTIAREEIFGPVLSILPYSTVDEAVEIANDTIYGLSNAVVGEDEDRALDVAKRLQSGQVMVNAPFGGLRAPFGGYKQSGDGREQGLHGLEDFLQMKAINLPRKSRHLR